MTFMVVVILPTGHCSGWNYKAGDTDGPENWKYDCKGKQQSPIDLPTSGVTSLILPPLAFSNYNLEPQKAVLINNGHSAKMSTEPTRPSETPLMYGGGLPHSYKFAQTHFHWGSDSSKGSEHTVGGKSYPMEMHLVHFKSSHATIVDALKEGAHDSLAVLGIFFEETEERNPAIDMILPYMSKMKNAHDQVEINAFPISSLLWMTDLSTFYRYNGSLTTPSCNEIVQWTVVQSPVPVCKDQMEAFRQLLADDSEPLVDNFRPTQDLGDRRVLHVTTVQQLEKGSHSSGDVVRSVGLIITVLVAKFLVL